MFREEIPEFFAVLTRNVTYFGRCLRSEKFRSDISKAVRSLGVVRKTRAFLNRTDTTAATQYVPSEDDETDYETVRAAIHDKPRRSSSKSSLGDDLDRVGGNGVSAGRLQSMNMRCILRWPEHRAASLYPMWAAILSSLTCVLTVT